VEEIVAELKSRDKRLARIIDLYPLCTIGAPSDETTRTKVSHFETLVETVISQQLAIKAADTIFGRLKLLAGGAITQERISALSEEDFRSVGVSGAKAKTIRGLATSSINFTQLPQLDDHVIRETLMSLWGIGTWTVDMYMIFQLGRLDIWPVGDLGVRRGWEKIYQLSEKITPAELEKKGEKFAPYRSVVAWYCWRALTPPQR